MNKQNLGLFLLLASGIHICFAAMIYKLSRRKKLEQNDAYDAKIDQVNKMSIRVQLGCLAIYGMYLCFEYVR